MDPSASTATNSLKQDDQPDLPPVTDAADEDALHLRARPKRPYQTGPSALEVDTKLKTAFAELERLEGDRSRRKAEPRTVDNVLADLEAVAVCVDALAEAGELFAQFLEHDIQRRRVRLVQHLSKRPSSKS